MWVHRDQYQSQAIFINVEHVGIWNQFQIAIFISIVDFEIFKKIEEYY